MYVCNINKENSPFFSVHNFLLFYFVNNIFELK